MHCSLSKNMKRSVAQISSLAAAGALFTAGCSNSSPGETTGAFGDRAAADSIARAMGANTADSMATGAPSGAIVGAVTFVIAKHEATEHQRRVAEARARAITARNRPARHISKTEPAPGKTAAHKLPRYIAVDTVRDERTSPRAQKSVMIFDTQAEQVVGNNVYDVQTAPKVGSTARFETYSAQYVGSGE